MLRWIYKAFFKILNRDHIPPLPRGMLATRYDELPEQERRVLARMGARDVMGVKLAMKRHKAESIDELVGMLDHYEAQRHVQERFNNAMGRLVGGVPYPPHQREIQQAMRERAQRGADKEVEQRLKHVRKIFKEKRQ